MKNGRTQPPKSMLTAREIHELLEKAKAIGVIRLELQDGLRFEFGNEKPTGDVYPNHYMPDSVRQNRAMIPPQGGVRPTCRVHGTAMNRSKYQNGPEFYCYDCSQENKQRVN